MIFNIIKNCVFWGVIFSGIFCLGRMSANSVEFNHMLNNSKSSFDQKITVSTWAIGMKEQLKKIVKFGQNEGKKIGSVHNRQ